MSETPRLLLRPMHENDVDAPLHLFADPEVMASFGGVLFARDDMARWLRRNLAHQDRYGYGLFSLIHQADGLLVGDCGLEHLADGDDVELGYDLRSDYWNRGLATEAAAAVRDYAFDVVKLPRLISLIRQGNRPSRRVAEKIGMHHVAAPVRDGQPYWLFALAAHDPRPALPRPAPAG